jgi:aminoglycoside/choline kinase family phosphotransferase
MRTWEIERFLECAGWSGARRIPLAGDASFRRYERVTRGAQRAILMDAPPPYEDIRPFVKIADHLRFLGYSAPYIYAENVELGALLLEDLGDDLFARVLDAGGDASLLYRHAVDLLVDLGQRDLPDHVPNYDIPSLLDEASLFIDWYFPAVSGRLIEAAEREAFMDVWQRVLPLAYEGPPVLVLRDYHVNNLIWLHRQKSISRVGLLDFQDAVVGPRMYDLVSLLEDARRDISPELVEEMFERFVTSTRSDRTAATAAYAVLGAQRNTKIIGIFTRLQQRDGKSDYLAYIPRVWRLLENDLEYPALSPVREWFTQHVPDCLRGSAITSSVFTL